MMAVGKDGWFEPARPIRVEGGIRARSRRGSIGERWWSRRFIDILERVCDSGRLSRGRAYARSGQVLRLDIAPGLVSADVQGSRPTPYQVSVEISAYGEADWATLQDAIAEQAVHRAKLLAGEMPPELEAVFTRCGLPLFPDEGAVEMQCSCPDWGFPCKHLSAVLYVLAEAFDDDPFLVLAWRGRAKDDLLDALRGMTGEPGDDESDPLHVEDVPFSERLGDFYAPGVSLARLQTRAGGAATPPDLLLRALDPPPVKVRHIPLLDLLRPAYRTMASVEPPVED